MQEEEENEPVHAVSQRQNDDNPPKEGGGDGDDKDYFAVAQLTSNPHDSRGMEAPLFKISFLFFSKDTQYKEQALSTYLSCT